MKLLRFLFPGIFFRQPSVEIEFDISKWEGFGRRAEEIRLPTIDKKNLKTYQG